MITSSPQWAGVGSAARGAAVLRPAHREPPPPPRHQPRCHQGHPQPDGLSTGRVDLMAYTVNAKRWEHGWELHIDGIGVTQSRLLSDAEAMVRDYLAADEISDAETAEVTIHPDLGGLADLIHAVRAQTEGAQIAQQEAARAARNLVAQLRQAGLSVADTATVLGVTKGRVSQLVSH